MRVCDQYPGFVNPLWVGALGVSATEGRGGHSRGIQICPCILVEISSFDRPDHSSTGIVYNCCNKCRIASLQCTLMMHSPVMKIYFETDPPLSFSVFPGSDQPKYIIFQV